MRKLTEPKKPPLDRGAVAVMVALMMTMLLAATGLGVDTAHVALDKSRLQHSADAAALAIATDCAKATVPACTKAGATGTVGSFLSAGAVSGSGGIVASALAPTDGTVTTTATTRVKTNFFNAFNIDHKDVATRATATWSNHAIAGDVVPFGISLCAYVKAGVGNPTLLRTDINDALQDVIVPKNNTPATVAYASMEPYLFPTACDVPADVRAAIPSLPSPVRMLQGGLWMSANGNSISNGKLLSTQVLESLKSVIDFKINHAEKFAPPIAANATLLFAIYSPISNPLHAGLELDGSNAAFKGTINMKVVGYAPFKISSYCFSGCIGTPGISGKFVSSAKPVASFDYGTGGGNFGAFQVKLTD